MPRRSRPALALPAVAALALSGCGQSVEAGQAATAQENERIGVTAGFYPLQFVSEAVGGDRVEVTNLTTPGAEPHDLELAPRDVAELSEAELVVYLSGFQPAVDDAVGSQSVEAFDVADAADLSLTAAPLEDEEAEGGHTDDEPAEGEETTDPHFWLDPLRLAAVGDAVADRLADIDPDGAQEYAANAEKLRSRLEELDAEMSETLGSCERTALVTSHNAFGYLADRYGFEQVGISGLSPDDEPSPAKLAELADFVRDNGVTTIYHETLVSPDTARTLAEETGAQTATLDPIEGITEESAGDDYVEVMRANLETLVQGQSCA